MDDSPQQRKVFMSRRAAEEGARPGYVYHQPPDAPWDSGWRAVVGDESRAEADDPASIVLQPVAEVLARWPELQPVLESGELGSSWRWDPESRRYLPMVGA